MGIMIGSAVAPLWNLMTWKKASGTGAVIAAWTGLALAVISWLVAAKVQGGTISVDTLGTNEVMLSGNLVAIFSSAFIHWFYSTFIDPQDYDFAQLDQNISLVEEDLRGLSDEEKDPVLLAKAERWILNRGYALALVLIIVWPLLSIPVGKFTQGYFAFWVLISLAWGFGGAIVITVLPLVESSEDINRVIFGVWNSIRGVEVEETEDENARKPLETTDKQMDEVEDKSSDVTPDKNLENVEVSQEA
jgi:hypothetical protein